MQLRLIAAAWTTVLTVAIAAGCGDGRTVVHIEGASNATISSGTLDHWMQAFAGRDFRETIGVPGPHGLVAEPADYRRCIDAAKLVAPRSFFNQLKYSRVVLTEKCHKLYGAVKEQALRFLISAKWATVEASERGIELSDAEVQRAFQRLRSARYPSEEDLRRYLTERHWSLSDLLYELRNELLANKLHPQSTLVADEAGGRFGYEKVLAERRHRLLMKTSCARGYVVPGCRTYRGLPTASLQPDSIIVHLVHED